MSVKSVAIAFGATLAFFFVNAGRASAQQRAPAEMSIGGQWIYRGDAVGAGFAAGGWNLDVAGTGFGSLVFEVGVGYRNFSRVQARQTLVSVLTGCRFQRNERGQSKFFQVLGGLSYTPGSQPPPGRDGIILPDTSAFALQVGGGKLFRTDRRVGFRVGGDFQYIVPSGGQLRVLAAAVIGMHR
jgi:hypothetical protein